MIFIGIILLVIGVIFFVNYTGSKKRLEEIGSTEGTTARSLHDIQQGVASEIGKGAFEQKIKISGTIRCDQPLESELAGEPCVFYRMSVDREWEEDYTEEYTEQDPKTGQQVKKTRPATRKGSDSMSSNTRSTRFKVVDDSGAIMVDPEGAELDQEQILDRFEPQKSTPGGVVSFGKYKIPMGNPNEGRRRTLGYHFREWVLPLNKTVYVLGAASDSSGELVIRKPREKGKFIISLKSEEQLVGSAKSSMTWGLYGAIACGVVGILLIIIDLIS